MAPPLQSRHFGTSVSFENCRSIAGVFEEVAAARCDYGLVVSGLGLRGWPPCSCVLEGYREVTSHTAEAHYSPGAPY